MNYFQLEPIRNMENVINRSENIKYNNAIRNNYDLK